MECAGLDKKGTFFIYFSNVITKILNFVPQKHTTHYDE